MKIPNFLLRKSTILIIFSLIFVALALFFSLEIKNYATGYEILDGNFSAGENLEQIITQNLQESAEISVEDATTVVENLGEGEEFLVENNTEIQNPSENFNETAEILNETERTFNETIQNETSFGQNQTLETNLTNETIRNETNFTEIINGTEQNVSETNETVLKNIKVELVYPKRITRGGTITVKAIVSNQETLAAENTVIQWKMPTGFQIIGDDRHFCGSLEPNYSCISEVSLKTGVSTTLGLNKIKVVVNYE